MSSGFRAGGSIPASVRKTIQNIKEIAGNHSEDEIYAMLKECSMDPNETAQKLLYQDTFHEVKRKRDKKKENANNKELNDNKFKSGGQGRGGRGGRGNYSSRHISHDASGGRNNTGKENGILQINGKSSASSSLLPESSDVQNNVNDPMSSSVTIANGSPGNGISMHVHPVHGHGETSASMAEISYGNKFANALLPTAEASHLIKPAPAFGKTGSSDKNMSTPDLGPLSGVASSSDPVLHPPLDTRIAGAVGTIKREVGSHRITQDTTITIPFEMKIIPSSYGNQMLLSEVASSEVANVEVSSSDKAASGIGSSFLQMVPSKPEVVERHLNQEGDQSVSSTHPGTSTGRSLPTFASRSQQVVGTQKALGPSMEWKPKPMNPVSGQVSGGLGQSNSTPSINEFGSQSQSTSVVAPEELTLKLQKKLDELHFSDGKHVIIPNHLRVPEAERSGLSFGSFDASFEVPAFGSDPEYGKSSTPLSETSQGAEESAEETSQSTSHVSTVAQDEYVNHPQSPPQTMDSLPAGLAEVSIKVSEGPDSDNSRADVSLASGGPQYSVVQATPNYSSFGLIPPMLGSQFPSFETTEAQGRDVSRLPSFVVQQPFDPSSSYYTPFYRPSADGDGRFSPFLAPGSATKFNGNITLLPNQASQSLQENSNSVVLSTAGPSPIGTQTAGLMQSSIAVAQQPVPVYRQPPGLALSHYPPNFMYNQYYSPVFVPPLHPFLNNMSYPQQPPPGAMYPPAAAAAAVKYPISQYKPGTNPASTTHVGMPTLYGNYGSTPAGYTAGTAAASGNPTTNEDLGSSQFKENNVYAGGQQSEGSAVWIPAPGRDLTSLQASSFYNLPPQGQHIAFGPTQPGHGAFAGLFHPAQTMTAAAVHPLLQQSQSMAPTVEVVGPQAGVYQQAQRAQLNWANSY